MLLVAMGPLLISPPADSAIAANIAKQCGGDIGELTLREFPDGELYVRIDTPLKGRNVWVICTMLPAGKKMHAAFMLGATAKDLGATHVALAAPYLAYLRQDSRFKPGEGITSRYVGIWLSSVFDEVLTLDPHLHRYETLSEVYAVPAKALPTAPRIASWVKKEIKNPVIVGPDMESAQWAKAVASVLDCPTIILEKVRFGDDNVQVSAPDSSDLSLLDGRTPVLLDDIICTGSTMVEALQLLKKAKANEPHCVGIHAVFAGEGNSVESRLIKAGAKRVVTCNTIPHPTNAIDIVPTLSDEIKRVRG